MLTAEALCDLAGKIEALPTATYADCSPNTNAWKRARSWPSEQWTQHLEFYPDVLTSGTQLEVTGQDGQLSVPLRIRVGIRRTPSETFVAEGRALAILVALWRCVNAWTYADDCRARCTGYSFSIPADGWIELTLNATATTWRS